MNMWQLILVIYVIGVLASYLVIYYDNEEYETSAFLAIILWPISLLIVAIILLEEGIYRLFNRWDKLI